MRRTQPEEKRASVAAGVTLEVAPEVRRKECIGGRGGTHQEEGIGGSWSDARGRSRSKKKGERETQPEEKRNASVAAGVTPEAAPEVRRNERDPAGRAAGTSSKPFQK